MMGDFENASMLSFNDFKKMISESLGICQSRLSGDVSLRDDLGIDSLSIVNFIVKLEKKYNIAFNIDKLWETNSLEGVYQAFQDCLVSPKETAN